MTIENQPLAAESQLLYTDATGQACAVTLPPQGGYLGRAIDCVVRSQDSMVARRHCKLTRQEDGFWYVEDTNGAVGTLVNENVIRSLTRLQSGDVIRCASLQVRYRAASPGPASRPAREAAPAAVGPPRSARLLYTDAAGTACSVELPVQGGFLGRAPECLVYTQDAAVARRQTRVYRRADGWYAEDLRSANGCFVNEQRVTDSVRLNHGDVIRCGTLQVRFVEVAQSEVSK